MTTTEQIRCTTCPNCKSFAAAIRSREPRTHAETIYPCAAPVTMLFTTAR